MLTIPIRTARMDPTVIERLLDADLLRSLYQQHTQKQAAEIVGCSPDTFAKALRHHGIEIRVKGTPPPGNGATRLTRQDVIKATMRAYLKSDRCPPSCPGRETCLNRDGRCILQELAR